MTAGVPLQSAKPQLDELRAAHVFVVRFTSFRLPPNSDVPPLNAPTLVMSAT